MQFSLSRRVKGTEATHIDKTQGDSVETLMRVRVIAPSSSILYWPENVLRAKCFRFLCQNVDLREFVLGEHFLASTGDWKTVLIPIFSHPSCLAWLVSSKKGVGVNNFWCGRTFANGRSSIVLFVISIVYARVSPHVPARTVQMSIISVRARQNNFFPRTFQCARSTPSLRLTFDSPRRAACRCQALLKLIISTDSVALFLGARLRG